MVVGLDVGRMKEKGYDGIHVNTDYSLLLFINNNNKYYYLLFIAHFCTALQICNTDATLLLLHTDPLREFLSAHPGVLLCLLDAFFVL